MKKIELATFQSGAISDLFGMEFARVLANIHDPNTVPNKARTITIKMEIKPDKTRRNAEVKVHSSSSLAAIRPTESFMFFDRDDKGKISAYEDDPGPVLPGMEEDNVIKYPEAQEAK
jgi:hypothetical protein